MELNVEYQDEYSRGELLLRTLLGWLYIGIPHLIGLMIFGIWAGIIGFIAFWAVLITGHYPRSFFDYQIKFMAWGARLQASFQNLVDGYPPIGTGATWDKVTFSADYPESSSRLLLLARLFLGALYVGIPHGIMLYLRQIAGMILMFLAFWVVLFTGNYPASWHAFNVGTLRWQLRVQLYMSLLTDEYPPFTGEP